MEELSYIVAYSAAAEDSLIVKGFPTKALAEVYFKSVKWQKTVFLLKILKKSELEGENRGVPISVVPKRNKAVHAKAKKSAGVAKKRVKGVKPAEK